MQFLSIYFIRRYLKAALLPNSQQSLRTSLASGALLKPVFGNSFSEPIPLNKLYTKTLQVNVFSVVGQREEIVVSCPLNELHNFQFNYLIQLKFVFRFVFFLAGLCSNQFGRILGRRCHHEMVQCFELQVDAQFRIA